MHDDENKNPLIEAIKTENIVMIKLLIDEFNAQVIEIKPD
jgi:hypothetical protein